MGRHTVRADPLVTGTLAVVILRKDSAGRRRAAHRRHVWYHIGCLPQQMGPYATYTRCVSVYYCGPDFVNLDVQTLFLK
jgi:hypothetical protein